ncbi:MAG: hypothetical protein LPK07_07235 [Hymenobacteraceae bacterium]|nr:hypothetical protein [Hymenobacteraceae bacterium]MDX5481460.1 hypothetical protein [Hymenobacteraceae bacterium]
MTEDNKQQNTPKKLLTEEQETILDLYIQKLDAVYEQLKTSEQVQVEIETQHLKKILFK